MLTTHAIGIDLGTTYSCIAYLNEHGEPVTLPNQEGELSTPSVVLFDDNDEVIVGTEALRNAILEPERVVQNSKRFIGDPDHRWNVNGKPYTPVDVATFVLKKMISAAQDQLGPIEQAVITVPAQFSDYQRQATVAAGHRAGLQRVDIINEPVAAALCYVLGSEGLWFTELADEQKILVYDLGGGTFDLSLVRYQKNEVSVIASSGDLNLGGIDWNHALEDAIAKQFRKEFGDDPTSDPSSKQFLALEAEQTKRSLSVRPRAAMTCQHAGRRKTYQVEQERFEKLTASLVEHTADITRRMLKESKHGWGRIDVVLTTGGSSRMPMIRNCLKSMSGTTLNTSLSPDQSIAHGATYYAGMLLTNSKFARSILNDDASSRLSQIRQKSVNARGLGIMVREVETSHRVPHYLIKPNTSLPTEVTETFGTVMPNQRRVHLQIVESGLDPKQPPVKLGACIIDDLPAKLPEGSEIAVTIRYDEQSLVHVDAKDVTSGKRASTKIVRHENLKPQLESPNGDEADVTTLKGDEDIAKPAVRNRPPRVESAKQAGASPKRKPAVRPAPKPRPVPPPKPKKRPARVAASRSTLEEADQPVALCNDCGEPLDNQGRCDKCGVRATHRQVKPATRRKTAKPAGESRSQRGAKSKRRKATPSPRPVPAPRKRNAGSRPGVIPAPPNPDEIIELGDDLPASGRRRTQRSTNRETQRPTRPKPRQRPADQNSGEDEFWELSE
ncbi:MAG: Hsp70 family protein [Planctomycetaceae bacterium]|jgi:molecular chaperone DnaK|nr:Hsp70 family protein [Planctomycetaceae bacterium]MBT6484442.1 Hsp70 family protein [Planctomycetaceae bacterium]